MSIPCKYCENPIYFNDNIVSKNGKKIPLQEWDHRVHDCELKPHHQNQSKIGVARIALGLMSDKDLGTDVIRISRGL